jgi:4'-phosphopantetheinyl transferase
LVSNKPKILYINDSADLKIVLANLDEFAAHEGLTQKRETEKKAARHVVKEVLQNQALEICYQPSGRPYLENGIGLSVSHAYDQLAVLFSFTEQQVGIDIEKVRDKVLKIREKFLSARELSDLHDADTEKYTLYWAAKEAVYKAHDTEGLIFAEQIAIEPFSAEEKKGEIRARVTREGSQRDYCLTYHLLNDYVLVYACACQ